MDKPLPYFFHTVFHLLAMFCLAGTLAAAPVRVFSPAGSAGVWSNPASWQPVGLPSPGEEVEIAAGKSCQVDVPVSLQAAVRIYPGAFLTISANSSLSSGGEIQIYGSGKLNVQDADLALLGNVPVLGTISLSGNGVLSFQNRTISLPSVSGTGNYRLRFSGSNRVPASSPTLEVPDLENNGELVWAGSLKVTHQLTNTGILRFENTSSLELYGSFLQSTGAKFNLENRSFPIKMHVSGNHRWQNSGSFFSGSQAEILLNTVFDPAFLNAGIAQMSSSLYIQSGSGVIRNTGTLVFTQNQGLWFSGNEDNRIESPSTIELFILQVNKTGGGVRFTGPAPLWVKDQISVLAGSLDLQGNPVVLKASSQFTGKITSIWGTISGAGLVTQEQFIPGPDAGWYFLGPVGINQTVASLSDDFQTTGPFPGATVSAPADRSSLFSFDGASDPTGSLSGEVMGWRIPVSGALETGKGYRAYLRSDFFNGRRVMDFTGPLVQGDFDFPVVYNPEGYSGGGWNFLSNPYPCPIDWNSDEWMFSNMSYALYIWNGQANQYGVFLRGMDPSEGINGVGPVIPAGQAFFVKATGSNPVLTATEAAKTGENGTFLRTRTSPVPSIRLRAVLANGSGDETLIRFSDLSDLNFDPLEDADKWVSASALQLANESVDGKRCSIQTLPPPSGFGPYQIPVYVKSSQSSRLAFTLRHPDLLPGSLFLFDSKTGIYTPVSENSEIQLEPNPSGERRYYLVIHTGTGIRSDLISNPKPEFHASVTAGKVKVQLANSSFSEADFRLLDFSGKELQTIHSTLSGKTEFEFPSPLNPGLFFVQKVENGHSQTLRLVVW